MGDTNSAFGDRWLDPLHPGNFKPTPPRIFALREFRRVWGVPRKPWSHQIADEINQQIVDEYLDNAHQLNRVERKLDDLLRLLDPNGIKLYKEVPTGLAEKHEKWLRSS